MKWIKRHLLGTIFITGSVMLTGSLCWLYAENLPHIVGAVGGLLMLSALVAALDV